jgi:long-subunit acyl-CoA synthetase (AMP-forming)
MEYEKRTIPQQLILGSERWPAAVAQLSKDANGEFQPTTYPQLVEEMYVTAAGFHEIGVEPGALVGLISENRKNGCWPTLACWPSVPPTFPGATTPCPPSWSIS